MSCNTTERWFHYLVWDHFFLDQIKITTTVLFIGFASEHTASFINKDESPRTKMRTTPTRQHHGNARPRRELSSTDENANATHAPASRQRQNTQSCRSRTQLAHSLALSLSLSLALCLCPCLCLCLCLRLCLCLCLRVAQAKLDVYIDRIEPISTYLMAPAVVRGNSMSFNDLAPLWVPCGGENWRPDSQLSLQANLKMRIMRLI